MAIGARTGSDQAGGSRAAKAAAVAFVAPALGFGLPTPFVLDHLARTGELPTTPFGFRSHSGPFEALGPEAFTALGWVLVGACALEALAGVWLWQGRRRGARLGAATTPVTLVLSLGFAFPFLLLAVPIRLGLVVAARSSLR
jgi:hypothetical protein